MTEPTPVPPWRPNRGLHNFIYKGGGFKPSESARQGLAPGGYSAAARPAENAPRRKRRG